GGEEGFSGYADRSLVAADGLTGLYEIGKLWRSGIGVATLAETGWLRPLPEGGDQIQRPYSYGFAVLLNGRSRSGRLEAGWRDHARWADGVLRLSVSQRW
ncbi:MAG TPA: hypothetical protein VLB27_10020, partial [candidate division Zixibacteria bacterium]|nr:hypothetical protein [candidate division Zixibacteria bacterium]